MTHVEVLAEDGTQIIVIKEGRVFILGEVEGLQMPSEETTEFLDFSLKTFDYFNREVPLRIKEVKFRETSLGWKWEVHNPRVKVTLTEGMGDNEVAVLEVSHMDENRLGHPRYISLDRNRLQGLAVMLDRLLKTSVNEDTK